MNEHMQYCGSCSYSDNVDIIGNSGNGDNHCFDVPETEHDCKHWKGGF